MYKHYNIQDNNGEIQKSARSSELWVNRIEVRGTISSISVIGISCIMDW